jgi:low temperature requirement protein LtrA
MVGRSPTESHRAATPLELFFDLCFVVAVSQAATRLAHSYGHEHAPLDVFSYAMVFFAIWWAWMNFTWFASAYDTDDVPYRLLTLLQIVGVLIVAAGIPRMFDDQDIGVVTLGYLVMRIGLGTQWLRAAAGHPERRRTCRRYAAGISACMVGWVVLLTLPHDARAIGFVVMVVAELSVPVWAEKAGWTPWHPEHIAERYGLFTLIVLGESLVAATVAFQSALDGESADRQLYVVAIGGVLTVFSMWWIYFAKPAGEILSFTRIAFWWGYGHYLVFASIAAVGAGLEVNVEVAAGQAELATVTAGATVTLPVAVYLLAAWVLVVLPHRLGAVHTVVYPVTVGLVLLATFTPQPVMVTGLLLCALVAVSVLHADQAHRRTRTPVPAVGATADRR